MGIYASLVDSPRKGPVVKIFGLFFAVSLTSCSTNSREAGDLRCHDMVLQWHIDGLVQERRNSIANALELRLSYTNPLICTIDLPAQHAGIDLMILPQYRCSSFFRGASDMTALSFKPLMLYPGSPQARLHVVQIGYDTAIVVHWLVMSPSKRCTWGDSQGSWKDRWIWLSARHWHKQYVRNKGGALSFLKEVDVLMKNKYCYGVISIWRYINVENYFSNGMVMWDKWFEYMTILPSFITVLAKRVTWKKCIIAL